jgi:hypothetical protein
MPEQAKINLSFRPETYKGETRWFAIRRQEVGDLNVTIKYVVPAYFERRGGIIDEDHVWSCEVRETLVTSPSGSFEEVCVIPRNMTCLTQQALLEMVPSEAVLRFEEQNGQLKCQRVDGRRDIIYVIDRDFQGSVKPKVRMACKITRVLHRSDDGNFLLVAVMPKEEVVTERAKRRRERRGGIHAVA